MKSIIHILSSLPSHGDGTELSWGPKNERQSVCQNREGKKTFALISRFFLFVRVYTLYCQSPFTTFSFTLCIRILSFAVRFPSTQLGVSFIYYFNILSIRFIHIFFCRSGPFLGGRTPTGVLPYTHWGRNCLVSPDPLHCIIGSVLCRAAGKVNTGRFFHSAP